MNPEQWREIRDKLQNVLEREPELRSARLEEIVRAHPDLRSEVESLVSSYDRMSADFLSPLARSSVTDAESEPLPESFIGRRLGPYQIVEHIGMGGMGEVFRASRVDNLYRKQVAIKLVRAGHDSEFVVNRFKHERQILATLDHTNIAHLLDGGATQEGLPYFVMDLIDGQPTLSGQSARGSHTAGRGFGSRSLHSAGRSQRGPLAG
jgi:hypothetical protein